jgi:hypothetical protein
MPMVHATWRSAHRFGVRENHQSEEAVLAQRRAEALRALKRMLPASEYERMADECQRGEREVRIENGFVMTYLSPK